MGDSTDGSSSAAQSAQDDQNRSFVGRIFDAFTQTPDGEDAVEAQLDEQPSITGSTLGLLNLRRLRVEDVMVPKADIWAAPVSHSLEDLITVFRDCALTRLPVFEGTLDTPLGFVNLKDVALGYGFNGHDKAWDLRGLLRPLLFVPPSMQLGILLQKMQADRTHMALVIDEYGGTDGLVTIEDLIEQVVGAIEDEHDIEQDKSWVLEDEGVYTALAKTALEDFEAEIGMDLTDHEEIDEEEIDSLGGLVFMLSGHVPVRGELVRHPAGVEFEVIDADARRIKRLRVRLPGASRG